MHGSVWEAQHGADTHGDDHTHGNTEETGESEIQSDMDHVHLAQHDNSVGEHDQVATSHEESIKEDGFTTDLTKTLGCIGQDCCGGCGTVESNLYELLFPGQ